MQFIKFFFLVFFSNALRPYCRAELSVSIIGKIFSNCPEGLPVLSDIRGEQDSHLAVNVIGEGNWDVGGSVYGIVTTWYQLAVNEELTQRSARDLRKLSDDKPSTLPQQERVIVQVRRFGRLNGQLACHPLLTRLVLNVVVMDVDATLSGDCNGYQSLCSLASLLVAKGPPEDSPNAYGNGIPLLVIGLITDDMTEPHKTDFEVGIASALNRIQCRLRPASSSRFCFYVNKSTGEEHQDDDDVYSIRSRLRAYAQSWKTSGSVNERELALLKRRQKEVATEASNFIETQRARISKSDVDKQLKYFHEKGVLFYPLGLDASHIVFNLDWMCKSIDSCIYTRPASIPPEFLSDLDSLRKDGLTKRSLIELMIQQESDNRLTSTLISMMNYCGICLLLESQSNRLTQPVYVDIATKTASRLMGTLPSAVVPDLMPSSLDDYMKSGSNRVTPIAIRSKLGIEIPYSLFCKLSYELMRRFPIGPRLSKYRSRFCVQLGYTLDLVYKRSYVILSMDVHSSNTIASSLTSTVCDAVRQFTLNTLASLQKHDGMNGLKFDLVGAICDENDDAFDRCDFVSGMNTSLSLDDMSLVFNDRGQDLEPPKMLFAWLGVGLQDSTVSERCCSMYVTTCRYNASSQ